jgi:cAMP-binding proteins - catabolite gene activator and regulatory subunit of cAMP-dependent protein kinases
MTNLQFRGDKVIPDCFLTDMVLGKRTLNFPKNETVFSQGDTADAVYYVQEGRVKLTVVSFGGKEATLCVLGPGDFFGVCCLGEQDSRSNTASTLQPSILVRIEKEAMLRSLRERPELFEAFMAYLLKRTVNLQRDLSTQILDPSEKRLARVLLRLTENIEEKNEQCVKMPKMSHDMLATMVGTTRSRVTYFMNKFRDQGFIDYDKGIMVRPTQLSAILQDDF